MDINKMKMRTPKVAVIGLAGQSAFMTAEEFPTPGETIGCKSLFFEPGGKGYNQAIACARMGVETVFVGAIGTDANGRECRDQLEREGILACLVEKEVPTAYAVITTRADGENTVAVYGGAAKCLLGTDLRSEKIQSVLNTCDYLLLQNELSADCLVEAFKLAEEQNIPVIFNPAPARDILPELLTMSMLITPNYGEAKELMGYQSEEALSDAELAEMFSKHGIKQAVITMGSKGSLLITDEKITRMPAVTCGTVIDTTGAGDTFNGTLVAALALGKSLEEAVGLAAITSGISVTRRGAAGSIPTVNEIKPWLGKLQEEIC